jgi:hypothetical protein
MASSCKKCGKAEHYNFVLNIGMCDSCIEKTLDKLQTENDKLKEALREIEKAEGAYSQDDLTFAQNTIMNMQSIATEALKGNQ